MLPGCFLIDFCASGTLVGLVRDLLRLMVVVLESCVEEAAVALLTVDFGAESFRLEEDRSE
ncbi:MAG: hypothetical protein KF861_10755 [Planctomycetaceae bacterium]|nr:hypothetical protein [Planctomycetaceae bacterium]